MQETLNHISLSPRETEVLSWISEGKSNATIAIILEIKRRTVEKHCENIFAKLGVENRLSAAIHYLSSPREMSS